MNNRTAQMVDLLRDSAQEVRTRGLSRRMLWNPAGEVCIGGAVYCALGVEPGGQSMPDVRLKESDLHRALGVLDRYLVQVGYERQVVRGGDIRWRSHLSVEWSNEVATDAEEVAQLLEKTAAWYEETEPFVSPLT